MKPTEGVLQALTQSSNVSVHSDVTLVGKVEAAIAADNKKRKENEDEPLRRKPSLVPIRQTELPRQFEVTLWGALKYTLGRGAHLRPLALVPPSTQSAGRSATPSTKTS
ncbi:MULTISPECIES: hypothetical protein [Streptomyces]|uniref:hypothetical protein n=1 Tax=Streptomyces TaxID=1883 RepID=UPI003674F69E